MNLFSLNFTSIEIEEERVSSSQKERTLGVRGGMCSKLNKGEQGERRGENSRILRESTFWMSL